MLRQRRLHCQRALFLAYHKGHTPIAYCASDVRSIHGTKVRLREVAARCKAFCDIFILNKQPHFLGPRVDVKARAPDAR